MNLALLLLAAQTFAPAPQCALPSGAAALLQSRLGSKSAFLFCEGRARPIRRVEPMRNEWLNQAGNPKFEGTARPGEFYVFQIGVYARRDIDPLTVVFTPLTGSNGSISRGDLRCVSLGGVNEPGKSFHKTIGVPKGALQPLWCGIDVPAGAKGTYHGFAQVGLGKGETVRVPITLLVEGQTVADFGAGNATSLARLRWLDSRAGEGSSIVKPFLPVRVAGDEIKILGREIRIGAGGMPSQIVSHFSAANTHIETKGHNILASPFGFFVHANGHVVPQKSRLDSITSDAQGAKWTATTSGDGFGITTHGRVDFTGSGQIAMSLVATRDIDLDDIRLDVPMRKDSAQFMMGLNRKGGLRPASHEWKWDVSRHQDCFWLGAVNGGLMLRLKGADYRRPLVNIYYKFLPLLMPDSWCNGGLGGVKVFEQGNEVIARSYSGRRHLVKGQSVHFIADFYVTPFRTIDTDRQWSIRFDHPHPSRLPKVLDDALASADPKHGPNVINVHQANYYNPYINYPYSPDSFPAFSDFVARAHAKGVKARVYYTTREITQNMPELYALHSLNGEIVFPGPGKDAKTVINPNGPNPWLIENLGSDFVPAWVDHVGGKYADLDISVITSPDSRWNNFYLEGLKWMVDKAKIDGIYIDDTALDASSLLRARRILSTRPDPIIDLHTWNHFNDWAGYANNLDMYMEVLPYLDRLWLGEGFSANDASWDYWLVEMSGLPFGLMSEMLDGPNTGRGLTFGETARLGWSGDPRAVWRVWDEYGIAGTEMIPFFDSACPVRTSDPNVRATVYRGKGRAFVALGSWSKATSVKLTIDWKALGLDPSRAQIIVPAIAGFQAARSYAPGETIDIAPNSGVFLVLRRSSWVGARSCATRLCPPD